MGRPGRDEDARSVEITRPHGREDGVRDLRGLAHPTGAGVAVRERTVDRSDEPHAARRKGCDVGLRCIRTPHPRVHRRCEDQRAVVLEQGRREKVVREPLREPRDRIRRTRRNDRDVGLVRQTNVEDLARTIPEGNVGGPAGQGREGLGSHESGRRVGEDGRDLHPRFGQQACEECGLVRRDATGDTEQYPATVWLGHVSRPR